MKPKPIITNTIAISKDDAIDVTKYMNEGKEDVNPESSQNVIIGKNYIVF